MIKAQQKNNKDKFFQKYTKGTLHSHSAIAPFGSPNTVYAVHSLHFALPYPPRADIAYTKRYRKYCSFKTNIFRKLY